MRGQELHGGIDGLKSLANPGLDVSCVCPSPHISYFSCQILAIMKNTPGSCF